MIKVEQYRKLLAELKLVVERHEIAGTMVHVSHPHVVAMLADGFNTEVVGAATVVHDPHYTKVLEGLREAYNLD